MAQAEGFEPTFSTPTTVTEVEAPPGYACINISNPNRAKVKIKDWVFQARLSKKMPKERY